MTFSFEGLTPTEFSATVREFLKLAEDHAIKSSSDPFIPGVTMVWRREKWRVMDALNAYDKG